MVTEPPEGWVRAWWAERQLDPGSAAYSSEPSEVSYWIPGTQVEDAVLANTLGRSWTNIGLPETLDRAEVDPRGLLVCGRWSLDWWVRAGEEWVFPSRAASVRQRPVGQMPVVETILRVGGGDVVHRVAAARGAAVQLEGAERHVTRGRGIRAAGDGASAVPEVFVVEIANRTPGPIAVALAARPYHLGAFEPAHGEMWGWSEAWGIDEIAVDGRVMTLDDGLRRAMGRATVIFDRLPGDVVVGSHGADCASELVASDDSQAAAEQPSLVSVSIGGGASAADPVSALQPESGLVSVTCPQGLANAAAVFPLVAGATLRAAVLGRDSAFEWDSLYSGADAGTAAGAARRGSDAEGADAGNRAHASSAPSSSALGGAVLDAVPGVDRVANGWRRRVDAGCRLELPDGRLADAALAARSAQMLATAPFDDGPGVVGPMLASALHTDAQFAGDDLIQLLALVESGFPEQVRDLLLRQAKAQDFSGVTTSMGISVTGSSLVLAEHLLTLHPDPAFAEGIGEFAAAGVRWLLRGDAERREEPWTVREGLRAGYRSLLRLGAERAASALRREAMSLPEALRVDVGAAAGSHDGARIRRRGRPQAHGSGAGAVESSSFYRDRLGNVPWETSDDSGFRARRMARFARQVSGGTASKAESEQQDRRWEWLSHDTGLWIHAAVPWAPPLPFVGAEPADGTPTDFVGDAAASCDHDMVATALLAFAEARPAPGRAFGRLEALVSVASPTLNWPTFMHPQLRTGTDGTGHDLVVGGLFVRTLLRLLVDVPDKGLDSSGLPAGGAANDAPASLRLAAHWPAAWLGQPVEVHDVPTRIGTVSWAVRWHGERPALLWDVAPHSPDATPPAVTAPGLDPTFSATGWRGEALLEAPPSA